MPKTQVYLNLISDFDRVCSKLILLDRIECVFEMSVEPVLGSEVFRAFIGHSVRLA